MSRYLERAVHLVQVDINQAGDMLCPLQVAAHPVEAIGTS
jgi:hypothetical protein